MVTVESMYLLYIKELTAKAVADAFYNGELEAEVRQRVMIDDLVFYQDSDREKHMTKMEIIRRTSLYTGHRCTEQCQERGQCECM